MTISEAEKKEKFIEISSSAESDSAFYQTLLAMLYYYGVGVSPSRRYAYMWFNIAAANYLDSSNRDREFNKNMRDGHMKDMTPELLADAKELAEQWIEKRQSDRYFLKAIESLYDPTNN